MWVSDCLLGSYGIREYIIWDLDRDHGSKAGHCEDQLLELELVSVCVEIFGMSVPCQSEPAHQKDLPGEPGALNCRSSTFTSTCGPQKHVSKGVGG